MKKKKMLAYKILLIGVMVTMAMGFKMTACAQEITNEIGAITFTGAVEEPQKEEPQKEEPQKETPRTETKQVTGKDTQGSQMQRSTKGYSIKTGDSILGVLCGLTVLAAGAGIVFIVRDKKKRRHM